ATHCSVFHGVHRSTRMHLLRIWREIAGDLRTCLRRMDRRDFSASPSRASAMYPDPRASWRLVSYVATGSHDSSIRGQQARSRSLATILKLRSMKRVFDNVVDCATGSVWMTVHGLASLASFPANSVIAGLGLVSCRWGRREPRRNRTIWPHQGS